jgi:putative ABC transport system substrate-binding protein
MARDSGRGWPRRHGPRFRKVYRQLARQLVKVLRGAKPADLPVEQPTEFELVLNLKTAQTLSLTIPPSILARADEITRVRRLKLTWV